MNRGDRREDIVRGDTDRELFVSTFGEGCVKCGWEVPAWCLMRDHFHLAVETPLGNLVAGMKWFLGAYTIRFNARHRLRGHLFAGRYKSLIVDDGDPHYLRVVCDYVHLNPSRAGLLIACRDDSDLAMNRAKASDGVVHLRLQPSPPSPQAIKEKTRTDPFSGKDLT